MNPLAKIDKILNEFLNGLQGREKILVYVGFVLVTVILPFLMIYQPAMQNNASLKQKIKDQALELQVLEVKSQVLKTALAKVENKSLAYQYFRDFSELLGFVGQQARKQNLEIVSFFPKAPGNKIPDEKAAGGDAPAGNRQALAEVKMQGTYESLFNFFREVGQTKYLLSFQTIEIKKNVILYPRLSVRMVLATAYDQN